MLDLNATQACIRAGYSPRSARTDGPRMLSNAVVAEKIAELKKELSERTQVKAEEVIQEYAKIAFSDLGDFCSWDEDGVYMNASKDLPKGLSRSLLEINVSKTIRRGGRDGEDVTETINTKLKLHPKVTALDALARHLGIFNDESGGLQPEQAAKMIQAFLLAGEMTDGKTEGE